jgi:YVTN family beta-propeller protein
MYRGSLEDDGQSRYLARRRAQRGRRRGTVSLSAVTLALLLLLGTAALRPTQSARAEETLLTTVNVAAQPEGVAVDPATNRVFVANSGQGSVTVIDGRTHARLGDFTIGGSPYGLAIHPAARKVFVSNSSSSSVSVINIDQGAFGALDAGTINVGAASRGLAANSVTNRLYVAIPSANQVGVFNTNTYAADAPLPIGANPEGIAVNETTNRVYVTSSSSTTVTVVDVVNGNSLTDVTVGTAPVGVAVNATTNRIYVANGGSNDVSVIDAALGNTVTTIALAGATPYGVAVNTHTNRIYVSRSAGGQNSISAIDGFTSTVDGSPVTVGTVPRGLAVNPNSSFLYVANRGSGNVSVLGAPGLAETLVGAADAGTGEFRVAVNPATSRVYVTTSDAVAAFDGMALQPVAGSPLPVGGAPRGLAFDTILNRVFVALNAAGAVAVIDAATNTVPGSINLGGGSAPHGVAVDSERHLVYLTRRNPAGVTVIDGSTGAVITTITSGIGPDPTDMAYNPDTRRLYVLSNGNASVSVINGTTNSAVGSPMNLGGPGASGLAVNPVTRRLYVARFIEGIVNVYDVNGDANVLITQVPIAGGAIGLQGIAVNPVTNRVYAAGGPGPKLTRIDGATSSVDGGQIVAADWPGNLAFNPNIARLYAVSPIGENGVQAFGPAYSLSKNTGLPGTAIQVTWDRLFGTSGGDRVGLYSPGADNGSPISVIFTNGSGSAGGDGVAGGTVNLAIPSGQAIGSYEVRLVSGHTHRTLGSLAFRVVATPVANAETYAVANGSTLTVPAAGGLLANDTDADTPAYWLQAAVVSGPTSGTLNLQADGAFTYTPRANFAGTDTFTYRVTDIDGQISNTAPVSITVTAVPCGPRPTVNVTTTVVNGGLQATVAATGTSGPSQTRIQTITFGTLQNAQVTMNGSAISSGQTVQAGGNTTTLTFTVRRQTPGQSTTVPFTVVDTCGSWPSFVGGGPNAGF